MNGSVWLLRRCVLIALMLLFFGGKSVASYVFLVGHTHSLHARELDEKLFELPLFDFRVSCPGPRHLV